jgi:3-phosphoshikimate 1-carboxyvinyltransferase
MLLAMGAPVRRNGLSVTIEPTEQLSPFELTVPADISSAAFFMVAATIVGDGEVLFRDLSVNPTRTGILDVLESSGVSGERKELGEPVADVLVRGGDRKAFEISGDLVPRLIDEIPVLAVLATQCEGTTVIKDAGELRVKESDRIERMAMGLRAMGAEVETFPDGIAISGPRSLHGTEIDAEGDHRIAMSFAVAGLVADGVTVIEGAESIATSFPGFEAELRRLSGG